MYRSEDLPQHGRADSLRNLADMHGRLRRQVTPSLAKAGCDVEADTCVPRLGTRVATTRRLSGSHAPPPSISLSQSDQEQHPSAEDYQHTDHSSNDELRGQRLVCSDHCESS
jgi:hypothetical protein